jgi:hypothetical protein
MAVVAIPNRSGKLTGRGATWTRTHFSGLRNSNAIPIYHVGERTTRVEVALDEAAAILNLSRTTDYRVVSISPPRTQQAWRLLHDSADNQVAAAVIPSLRTDPSAVTVAGSSPAAPHRLAHKLKRPRPR